VNEADPQAFLIQQAVTPFVTPLHPPPGRWLRHQDRSGTPGPQGCDDNDLHSCLKSGWTRSAESSRWADVYTQSPAAIMGLCRSAITELCRPVFVANNRLLWTLTSPREKGKTYPIIGILRTELCRSAHLVVRRIRESTTASADQTRTLMMDLN